VSLAAGSAVCLAVSSGNAETDATNAACSLMTGHVETRKDVTIFSLRLGAHWEMLERHQIASMNRPSIDKARAMHAKSNHKRFIETSQA
jgi:sialic acid synthase SpsE